MKPNGKFNVGYDLKTKRVFVAGHRGMVGSAIVRRLESEDCTVLTATRAELDLTNQAAVQGWFEAHKPDAVFLAAAKVGGIYANDKFPADFLYDNLMIEANIIKSAFDAKVQKLLFLGSSCIYPRLADQPIKESALLEGALEPTNEWYAIAKIAGIKLCQAYRKQHGVDFISAMPTNLYGPNDNFDLKTSHVLPALIRKVDDAKMAGDAHVTMWGTGVPLREFMHADDCADALVFLMQNYSGHEHVNVGSCQEVSIMELMQMIARLSDYSGKIVTDTSQPDGTPRKLMDGAKLMGMGWQPAIPLEDGVLSAIKYYNEIKADLP